MQTGLSFFRLTLMGMGLQKSKWIPNGWALRLLYLLIMMQPVSSHPTSTPPHWQFYVMLPATFKSEGHANWPARLQVELYKGNLKIINKQHQLEHVDNIPKFNFEYFSSFSITHKVKRINQTTDDICLEVRISSIIRCHFTRYHSSITA
jgi:hypothetical protein